MKKALINASIYKSEKQAILIEDNKYIISLFKSNVIVPNADLEFF